MSLDQTLVRPAKARDAVAIADVHDAAWRSAYRGIVPGVALERMVERRGPAWWHSLIAQQRGVLVLEVAGKLAGYVTLGPNRSQTLAVRGEIYELYIHPVYQGLGFGAQLFAAARAQLEQAKLVPFVVWALEDNDVATQFYRARGGEAVAHGVEHFGAGAARERGAAKGRRNGRSAGELHASKSGVPELDVAEASTTAHSGACRKLAFVWGQAR